MSLPQDDSDICYVFQLSASASSGPWVVQIAFVL